MSTGLARLVAAIDQANAADPNRHEGRPLAQIQGELACGWLDRLADDPATEVVVAARAHHLERWTLARSDYPDGRAGYLRWRRDNKAHQADRAVALAATYAPDLDAERLRDLLLRKGLGSDPDTQLIEDVACLVFLQTQFDELSERLEFDHLVEVVRRTLAKMSDSAIALALDVPIGSVARSALEAAVGD